MRRYCEGVLIGCVNAQRRCVNALRGCVVPAQYGHVTHRDVCEPEARVMVMVSRVLACSSNILLFVVVVGRDGKGKGKGKGQR